jgi:hypothetical protein
MAEPVTEAAVRQMNARMTGLAAALLIFLISATPALSQQDARAVRSAFVFNLTKYVVWPQSKRTLVIGFVGEPGAGTIMKQMLDARSTEGRTLQVVLNPSETNLTSCDILYVTSAESGKLGNILSRLNRSPVLTVGEDSRFTQRGGIVGLIRSGDQIQIEVNLESLHAAGLKMSSRLLQLATIVSTRSR